MMMRFDVYKGGELAATLAYGVEPHYYGTEGAEIAALIAGTAVVYNLWTRESATDPASDRADWWAARIISAPLARAGFVLRPIFQRVELDAGRCALAHEAATPATCIPMV
ncbi:MAG TPA: hypothetical protein VIL85_23060 [Thermomicrobiales bacterium]|jgi:N-formylglutamate amidohydrolase